MANKDLSAVEQAEALATAKREAVASAAPAAQAAPAPASGPRIAFTAKSGSTKRGAQYKAEGSILGLFGQLRIVQHGFVLALDNREIVVYMPGTQYSKSIAPASLRTVVDTGGRTIHEADPIGLRDMAKLENAIRDAWAEANGTGNPFTGSWPLAL